MNKSVKLLIKNAILASIYIILTILFPALTFGPIQLRIGEILLFLAIINPKLSYGLIVGVLVANIISPLGIVDVIFGGLATIVVLILSIIFTKINPKLDILTILFASLINGIAIGLEYYFVMELDFILMFIEVFTSEMIVMMIGYFVYKAILKNQKMMELLND